jgi:hypothetical protein
MRAILCTLILFMATNTWSIGRDIVAEKAGQYLRTVDMMEKLQYSRCSYLVNTKYSFEDALSEVFLSMNTSERTHIAMFIQNGAFSNSLPFIKNIFQGFIRDGHDEKSACGLVVGMVSSEFSSAQKEWNSVKSLLE